MKKSTSESRSSLLALTVAIALGFVIAVAWAEPLQDTESGFSWKDGAEVYAKVCAYCHETKIGPTFRDRSLDPNYIGIMVRIGYRAMPSFRSSEIDDQSLKKVADYVSKLQVDNQ